MTAASTDVAIIGVSFELPGCSDWPELEEILRDGRDCVADYPQPRVDALGLIRGEQDMTGCWRDEIGAFDHRYFGLSRADAELIDPRQRRMLSLAVQAIGKAGYAPGELRGRDVAVLIAGYSGIHPTLLDHLEPQDRATGRAYAGSIPAYSAGRIAYHLDLRGPAFVVDTACSSFLVALHEARWKLARGESELALVGGYRALLGDIPAKPVAGKGMGVTSPSGRCLPFDAAADGAILGEGGGFVLLKPLAAALRDGDAVHAVIRGSALNQDAGRSNGLAAPSPVAQAEVIGKALRDADIDPATVGYVEAHGTGTRLGDPIEMRALAQSYGAYPTPAGSRPVSSVKANFGHLDAMAGFAGLVRVISQFRAGRIFRTANHRSLNPLIDLTGVPLHVADSNREWPDAPGPRRAGISGFGVSGTNAHVIVEEGPDRAPRQESTGRERLVLISASRDAALRTAAEQLREAAGSGDTDLDTLADVLAAGREHFEHRHAWIAGDLESLAKQIDATLDAEPAPPLAGTPVVLALGDAPFADQDPDRSAARRDLVRLVELYSVLKRSAARFDAVLAHGAGVLASRVGNGELDIDAALSSVVAADAAPDPDRLRGALNRLGPDVTVIDLAPGGPLSEALATLPGVSMIPVSSPSSIDAALRVLYLQGQEIDWAAVLGQVPRRAELPVAPMAESPCWPSVRAWHAADPAEPEPVEDELDPTAAVLSITRELLKEPVTADDDFFARGGDSLNGALLVARLNQRFGTDLGVLDLYDYPNLGELAQALAPQVTAAPASAPTQAPAALEPLSGQQTAIWTAEAMDPDSDAYSVPAALLVHGELDPERLDAALGALVARHEALRCTLQDTEDGPRQLLATTADQASRLERVELDLSDLTASAGRAELLTRLRGLIAEPLRPYQGPTSRFHLVLARFRDVDQQILVLNFHHLFFDGWSWKLVMRELASTEPLPAPERGYLDYVRDQASMLDGERGERLRGFWTDYLDQAVPGRLPADRGSCEPSASGADLTTVVAGAPAEKLRALAAEERASLNMIVLAAWAVLLWQITGDTDLCVAMPVANRPPGDEQVIGCYVNTIPVRIRVEPRLTFGELVRRVRESSLKAIGHGDFPTDRILRAGRHASGQPLAATMLGFHNAGGPDRFGPDGPLLEALDVRQSGAQLPLELTVYNRAEEISIRLRYMAELFLPSTASSWLGRFAELLGRIADEGPELGLDTLAPRPPSAVPDFDF